MEVKKRTPIEYYKKHVCELIVQLSSEEGVNTHKFKQYDLDFILILNKILRASPHNLNVQENTMRLLCHILFCTSPDRLDIPDTDLEVLVGADLIQHTLAGLNIMLNRDEVCLNSCESAASIIYKLVSSFIRSYGRRKKKTPGEGVSALPNRSLEEIAELFKECLFPLLRLYRFGIENWDTLVITFETVRNLLMTSKNLRQYFVDQGGIEFLIEEDPKEGCFDFCVVCELITKLAKDAQLVPALIERGCIEYILEPLNDMEFLDSTEDPEHDDDVKTLEFALSVIEEFLNFDEGVEAMVQREAVQSLIRLFKHINLEKEKKAEILTTLIKFARKNKLAKDTLNIKH